MYTIDLSSDEETPTPTQTIHDFATSSVVIQHKKPIQSCPRKIKSTNDFIDHVVMIWLCRVQSGYKNIEIPSNILKAKAFEAAKVLKVNYFSEDEWLDRFEAKMKFMQDNQETLDLGTSNAYRIEQIIDEERDKFFVKFSKLKSIKVSESEKLKTNNKNKKVKLSEILEEQKRNLEQIKAAQNQQTEKAVENDGSEMNKGQSNSGTTPVVYPVQFTVLHTDADFNRPSTRIPPAENEIVCLDDDENDADDDVLDDPIESYDEVLDCLGLVEDYLLSVRNMKAAVLTNAIENFLKKQM